MCYWYSVHYRLAEEEGLTGKGVYRYEFFECSSLDRLCVGEQKECPWECPVESRWQIGKG